MANIKPFKGYRYNVEEIDDLGAVMAPPYDSISEDDNSKYYELHPYNAIRLISGMKAENDTEENNCYTRAAQFLKEWIEKGILVKDDADCIYLYEQAVTIKRERYYNRGFVALLELSDYEEGIVVPCEEPSTNSKRERFNMIKATQANSSMISCLYMDEEKQLNNLITDISEEQPLMEFETPEGIQQKVWAIKYQPTIDFIVKCLKNKSLYIVDGHNRYEAALEYQQYAKEHNPGHTGSEAYNYMLALLSDVHEDGRIHLPIHRLVRFKKGFREDYFVAGAQDHFKVEKIIVDTTDDSMAETMRKQIATQRKEIIIALYTGGDYFYRLRLTDPGYLEKILPEKSETYRNLDVTVLNKLLLEEILYITNETSYERIAYTRNAEEGINAVKNGEFGCMFVINPVRQTQLSEVARSGERMPRRSVCIFPKPATGVIISKFE